MQKFNYGRRVAGLAILAIASAVGTANAQDTGASNSGFRGFLHRTASAITGTPPPAAPITVDRASGLVEGPTTTSPIYRPLSPAAGGQFPGIFTGYSIAKNDPKGHYPRVALTAEIYGGTLACWTFRATVWQSAKSHHDERFELCNAPLTSHDDLGNPVEIVDPTMTLMGLIMSRRTGPSSYYSVSQERTTGPDPAAAPFAITVDMSTPTGKALVWQYDHLLTRAMAVSGYASPAELMAGNGLRMSPTIAGDGRLMWFAGFAPGGNRDGAFPALNGGR